MSRVHLPTTERAIHSVVFLFLVSCFEFLVFSEKHKKDPPGSLASSPARKLA